MYNTTSNTRTEHLALDTYFKFISVLFPTVVQLLPNLVKFPLLLYLPTYLPT